MKGPYTVVWLLSWVPIQAASGIIIINWFTGSPWLHLVKWTNVNLLWWRNRVGSCAFQGETVSSPGKFPQGRNIGEQPQFCSAYCTWSPSARKFLSPEAGYSRCWINQDRPHVSRPSTPTQHASPAEICAVSEKHSELAHMVLKSWNSAVSFIRLFPTWSWTQCGGETFRPPVPAVLRMPSVLCCCCQHPQVWI